MVNVLKDFLKVFMCRFKITKKKINLELQCLIKIIRGRKEFPIEDEMFSKKNR